MLSDNEHDISMLSNLGLKKKSNQNHLNTDTKHAAIRLSCTVISVFY